MKNKTKTYKSEALAAIHETVSGMLDAGVIDKQTMRHFDESCLTPVHGFTGEEIRALREREEVSQTVFAYYLECDEGFCQPVGTRAKKACRSLSETAFVGRAQRACSDCLKSHIVVS